MATVNKDFKIKSGLIVEGTTATVNGHDVLTKKQADQDYIVGLIGGTSTSANTANTVVKRNADGDFAAGTITADLVGDVTGNADTATALETSRTIELTGDVTGSVSFDGTSNVQISTTLGGSFATDAEVATAKDEAIDAAEAYTDGRETAITTAYQSYADTAEADAISAAASDATTKANNALASANSYTDDEISALDLSLKAYADQAESDAVSTAAADATTEANAAKTGAELTASNALASAVSELEAYADQSQTDAEAFATSADTTLYGTVTTDIATAKSQAISAAEDYTDTAVANLVDGAPALLDTLNELALAIADNPNYATDVANLVATKADTTYVDDEIADAIQATTYTAGTNIDITGNVVSVTGLDTADVEEDASRLYFTNQRAVDANFGLWDTEGAAAQALSDANDYTNGQITQEVSDRNSAISSAITTEIADRNTAINAAIATEVTDRNTAITTAVDALSTSDIEEGSNLYFTNQRAIDAVGGTIGDQINLLTTDDIEEGQSNEYFTDVRAKTSAAALLTGAAKTNITITGDENGLTITAENGVADSTTSDLAEGSNLYFTDARVTTAIANATHIAPQAIDITWVRREEATWTDVPTASQVVCHQAGSSEGSMKYLVRVTSSVGGTRHSHVTELLATVDGSNGVAVVEYGTIYTSAEPLATATVLWNGLTNCYELNVTTANNNSEVMVAATMLAVLD